MLEELYPIKLLEKHKLFALLLGVAYAIIGIGLAVLLFPEDPALVAVAFISIMFYPTINRLLKQEEEIESKKDEFSLFLFLKDHKHVFIIYILFFVGVLIAFAYFSLLLPSLASNHIFSNQFQVHFGGRAIFLTGLFSDILLNNVIVLLVILFTAFFIGDGGVFLITWNASIWGTIFGNLAKTAAFNSNQNPFYLFGLVILIVTPHMILEAFAYITSAATGGVISKALFKEKLGSNRFVHILVNTFVAIIFAFAILLVAGIVETYVLGNVDTYREIIRLSLGR